MKCPLYIKLMYPKKMSQRISPMHFIDFLPMNLNHFTKRLLTGVWTFVVYSLEQKIILQKVKEETDIYRQKLKIPF